MRLTPSFPSPGGRAGGKRKKLKRKLLERFPSARKDLPRTPTEYDDLVEELALLPEADRLHAYWILARVDLYFLIRYVLNIGGKSDRHTGEVLFAKQFCIDRCREVQEWSHGILDIWARGHWKTTIKTVGLTIQDLLIDSEETVGTFSHNRSLAKSFGRLIRSELEDNALLQELSFDFERGVHTFWRDPRKESPVWSLDEGLTINRRFEQHTATLEFWGLVDSHPTGKHYSILSYDDLVTKESVSTPAQIEKVTRAWEESRNLGVPESGTSRYTGTFWSYGDSYHSLLERGVELRLHPCYELLDVTYVGNTNKPLVVTVDEDKPVLYSKEFLEKQHEEMGDSVFNIQMRCDPSASVTTSMSKDWLRFYEGPAKDEALGKNIYIIMDQAEGGKTSKLWSNDYTVIWVLAAGSDRNVVVLDGLRDKIALKERAEELFRLHRKWNHPSHRVVETRVEHYGLMSDGQHITFVQEIEKYRFPLVSVGGFLNKDKRIARLQPWFSDGRIILPEELPLVRRNGEVYDLIKEFIEEEYLKWPHCSTRDMLDALARIDEPEHPVRWPIDGGTSDEDETRKEFMRRVGGDGEDGSWMSW